MNELEEMIRQSLRSEAARLHEVDPLRLPPAAARRGRRRAVRFPRLNAWYAPLAAAVAVLLVATVLVGARALRNEDASSGARSGSAAVPVKPLPDGATPRYYVRPGWGGANSTIAVGDALTGKTIGSYNLPKGGTLAWAGSGAGDDRTFVVEATTSGTAANPETGSPRWYLVKIVPGSAQPVRVSSLDIEAAPVTANATFITSVALSADGTELAVVTNTGRSAGLGVYSIATGRLQHSWSAAIRKVSQVDTPVFDPSWVGDNTVAFAFTSISNVREDVRTINVSGGGSSLIGDSHVVWNQEVARSSATHAPALCTSPRLTGNGRAVVCAASSYSASTRQLTALWLAYPATVPAPLAAPGRVIGSVTEPKNVSSFDGDITVDWTNPSGTRVIGSWNPAVSIDGGESVTNHIALIGHGKVQQLPRTGSFVRDVAW